MQRVKGKWFSKRLVWAILVAALVVLLALMLPAVGLAQAEGGGESELAPLLEQLLVPGVLGAVVGALLSYVVEWFPAYDTLNAKAKRLVFFAAALVISGGAGALIPILRGATPQWDPILANAITASLAAWAGGTLAHTRELPS